MEVSPPFCAVCCVLGGGAALLGGVGELGGDGTEASVHGYSAQV